MEEVKTPKKPRRRKEQEFKVRVDIPLLNIRTGPGKIYTKTGFHTGVGEFVITKVEPGEGSEKGWGKLKSGEGWISMDHVERI